MMKSTGIVRKVDELGRVVIPIELRRTLSIGEKDALEIYVDGDRIVLKNMSLPVSFAVKQTRSYISKVKIFALVASLKWDNNNSFSNTLPIHHLLMVQ